MACLRNPYPNQALALRTLEAILAARKPAGDAHVVASHWVGAVAIDDGGIPDVRVLSEGDDDKTRA